MQSDEIFSNCHANVLFEVLKDPAGEQDDLGPVVQS